MFSRIAAINMPGVILSQFEMQTIASAQWALTMYSTEFGDQLPRGERVQHPVVAHRDAIIDGDRVEFFGDAARCLNLTGHQLAEVFEVDVARHELGEAVHDGDDRLAEVAVFHARGPPQAARACHVAAMGGRAGTIDGHRNLLGLFGAGDAPEKGGNQALSGEYEGWDDDVQAGEIDPRRQSVRLRDTQHYHVISIRYI